MNHSKVAKYSEALDNLMKKTGLIDKPNRRMYAYLLAKQEITRQ